MRDNDYQNLHYESGTREILFSHLLYKFKKFYQIADHCLHRSHKE